MGHYQTPVSALLSSFEHSLKSGVYYSLHHHAKVPESYAESCGNAGFEYYDLVRCGTSFGDTEADL